MCLYSCASCDHREPGINDRHFHDNDCVSASTYAGYRATDAFT
ncbi:MAG TPA: hypothetical protein VHZ02_04730 [Acidimicrobiales bacterium]|jgi:hypothetical protein|nr:hypothetical protein [Acidimicrobiales bacterium]